MHEDCPQHEWTRCAWPLQKAVDFTDSQVEDLLYLRQLLYCKQGQMARERKALLSNMTSNNLEYMGHVSDKLSELTQWSEQLRKNGAEEYRVSVDFCSAYYSGVSCQLITQHG